MIVCPMTKNVKIAIGLAVISVVSLCVLYAVFNRGNSLSSDASDWVTFFSFITIIPTFVIVVATLFATSGTKTEVEKGNREIRQQIILRLGDCFSACISSSDPVDRIAISRLEGELMALEHSELFEISSDRLEQIRKTTSGLAKSYRENYDEMNIVLVQILGHKNTLDRQWKELISELYSQLNK